MFWNYVWSGYAVTIDARRRVMLGMRSEPRLPLALAEPEPRFERDLVRLRVGGGVVETPEPRPDRAGDLQPQVVLRCR
jgi:hypothetical protein